MLNYKITAQPTTEPITTAETKSHLRLVSNTEGVHPDDTYIDSLIAAARAYAENVTGSAFATKTVVAVCGSFPRSRFIELPVQPVASLTKVEYTDEDGITAEITDTLSLDDYSLPPRLVLNPSENWPSATLHPVNPIKITYQAGATPSDLIKSAMLLLIGHWYENREEVVSGVESYTVPFAADAILQQHRHGRT